MEYNAFVEKEILSWKDKGVNWEYPKSDEENKEEAKYNNAIVENFIMTVYKNRMTKDNTCKFIKLLLLFTHQTVIGRILASYAQIPEYLRNIHVNNKQFTSIELLEWTWKEKGGKNGLESIPVDFRRVYLIYLTNYLNRLWQFYHIDLDKENLDSQSEEYIHIQSIQTSLNEIIESTKESTKDKQLLSKTIVFEKIAENCCAVCGAMMDALRFKYPPIVINDLQQLFNVISLIALQINELYRPLEQEWINDTNNYKSGHLPNKSGDENFITLVIKNEQNGKHVQQKSISPIDSK